MRTPLWLILLVFGVIGGVGLLGLTADTVSGSERAFSPGGLVDALLDLFAMGLMFWFFVLPLGLLGFALVVQPGREGKKRRNRKKKNVVVEQEPPEPYRLWKTALGLVLILFAFSLARSTIAEGGPSRSNTPAASP